MRAAIAGLMAAGMLALAGPALALDVGLKWQDNSDNEDGFIVERRVGAGGYAELARTAANISVFTDVNVPVGFVICYKVFAFNKVGTSGPSNEACISVFVPAAPTNLGGSF